MKTANRLKDNDLSFDRDFLLLHEILEILRNVGLKVIEVGGQARMIPLYEFQQTTAQLHFGTLVGMLNQPKKVTCLPAARRSIQTLQLTTSEVDLTRYDWDTVAIAIEILVARKEVCKEVQVPYTELKGKVITLTEEGLYSLNTQKYLKEYRKERDERSLRASTLSTNRLTRLVGLISIPAAIFAAVIGLLQFNKQDSIRKEDVRQLIHAVEQMKQGVPPPPADFRPIKK